MNPLVVLASSLKNARKGNVDTALGLAMMGIALYMATMGIGGMSTLSSGLTGKPLAGFNNVTYYVFIGLRLGSIGMIVYAAFNMFGMFGIGRRRGR